MILLKPSSIDFDDILKISNESFTGQEIAPEENLHWQVNHALGVFVEEERGRICAYAILIENRDGPYLWSLATAAYARGCGHASRLLRQVIEFCEVRGYPAIELTCNVYNPAQKLYFDFGFRATRVIPEYYGYVSGLRMRRKSQ